MLIFPVSNKGNVLNGFMRPYAHGTLPAFLATAQNQVVGHNLKLKKERSGKERSDAALRGAKSMFFTRSRRIAQAAPQAAALCGGAGRSIARHDVASSLALANRAGGIVENYTKRLFDGFAVIGGNLKQLIDFPIRLSYNVGYKTDNNRIGIQMNAIQTFDNSTTASIKQMLVDQHARLGQLDRPTAQRSITARNYDSGIRALGEYLAAHGHTLPTRSALTAWRDDMLAGRADVENTVYSVSTVKARLAAARKLLRAVADDVTDLQVKLVLNDWSKVADPKATVIQDKTDADYGRRLTLDSLRALVGSIDTSHIKGLRDRALIAVMAGAGLRVSEAANLTIADVLSTVNESGQRGIRVRIGKHHKSRIVVLNGWNSWVIKAVEAYIGALGLSALETPAERVFRGIQANRDGSYSTSGDSLTTRGAHRAIADYTAEYQGEMVTLSPHDLRRTYAKISKQSGMTWGALRANMGHSSEMITEKYVGLDVDWSERVPNWTIELK